MFDTSFSYASSSPLPSTLAPDDVVLKLLHDFGTIIHLNPDTRGFQPLNGGAVDGEALNTTTEYMVEDNIAFIPKKLWSGGVSYRAAFTPVEDGCDVLIKAPGGFTSTNHWRLERNGAGDNDGARAINITSDAKCSKTYASFVKKFLANSHAQLQRGFKETVEKRVRPGMQRRRSSW